MSWATCYSGSDNINFSYPPLMSDGRNFSNWQPVNTIDKSLQKENNLKTNWQYRQYLMKNADNIIKFNQLQSCNGCGYCPPKYNTVGDVNNHGPPKFFDCNNKNVGYESGDLKNMYLSRVQLQERLFVPHLSQQQYIDLGYNNFN